MINQCDLCRCFPAEYDGRAQGQTAWAYMCERCFKQYGVGLGLGKGQVLLRKIEETDDTGRNIR